jgi:hypothetical protein
MALPDPETLERHCPRLGGRVRLAYCRDSATSPPPCDKIRDCWWERLDIDQLLARTLPPEALARLADAPPRGKIATLLELIARARAGNP